MNGKDLETAPLMVNLTCNALDKSKKLI